MKTLIIGDVVGRPGRKMVREYLPKLKKKYRPQFTIVNGENAAGGKGITKKVYRQLLEAGAHVITMGNHTWDNREIFEFIDEAPRLVRPANFPAGTPGSGVTMVKINSIEVAVINLQGRTFMPDLDDPFRIADELIAEIQKKTPFIFVDFHAEATSEKQALGWYLDGKVTAVFGTHTHVQTNDARILPQGTAYLTDVGMTGAYDSIIGMKIESVLNKFLTQLPSRFEVAAGREQLNGAVIDVDPVTGRALAIEAFVISPDRPFEP